MKIIIATDSFKGTMSSVEACDIIEKAIKNVSSQIETVKIPVADGGEGLVDSILAVKSGQIIKKIVKGPNFTPVDAYYGIIDQNNTAVIEMASASGIIIAQKNSNPYDTTTYGTGQLILDALDNGCTKIILGIGGSATNDAGIGMAAAFGVKFLDKNGDEIPLTGGGLEKLETIDCSGIDKRLRDTEFLIACDVDNPLYGENGASYIFAPQKGADPVTVQKLDNNLKHFANILHKFTGYKIDDIPGTGAAGGIASCLLPFAKSTLQSGIHIVLDTADFDSAISDADLIITGEGKIDAQSLRGKVVVGIAERASLKQIPVIVVAGNVENITEEFYKKGISAVFCTTQAAKSFEEIKPFCKEFLFQTISNIIRLYMMSKSL